MTLTQVWGLLVILILCPLLGGLPLIRWITFAFTHQDLRQVGTGNISVSAAFYHGGTAIGILAVLSEAFKGIAAVLLARFFFPAAPVWEIVALMALIMGRYWFGKGAGTTNVVWGYVAHDWIGAGLIFVISGALFTILRERQLGKFGVLVLIPLIAALRHPNEGSRIAATMLLCLLIAWIYQKIPDDLELSTDQAQGSSRRMFRFFRGDRALRSLQQDLSADQVGAKAATLAQLHRWGYPIPMGWVLPPGDDPAPLIELLQPSQTSPVIVRSSAIGEDSEVASAAGQYESIANITDKSQLEQAILRCQSSYNRAAAQRYRQDRGLPEQGMAVLVQQQVQGVFSGVAFSRDPIQRQGDAVVIEALPGSASRVVSGQVTPEQFRVYGDGTWETGKEETLRVEGNATNAGDVPIGLIQQVALLVRQLEERYHGIPQDMEWSYDGQQLWVLQSRPVTTLLPIWTRKIAAEVIPGFIPPLTWSVNRPLTCGVWGDLFTVVLGDRAQGLNFMETATLHHGAAYFNATLLGETFHQMGLPAESLEFLTRGAKFSKPPLSATFRNVPGLLRLLQREWRLVEDFERDRQAHFAPALTHLAATPADRQSPPELLTRIEQILQLLQRATYYSILAPLSAALRQSLFKVPDDQIDKGQLPEVASLRSLQTLATQSRPALANTLPLEHLSFADLAETPASQPLLQGFDRFLQQYGYLSEVATDISVPTWRENPSVVQQLLVQFLAREGVGSGEWGVGESLGSSQSFKGKASKEQASKGQAATSRSFKAKKVQARIDLKGQVSEVYSRLLAELRWSFVALERQWLATQWLQQSGDIFFLTWEEVQRLEEGDRTLLQTLQTQIDHRRKQRARDRQSTPAMLVYGNDPPAIATPSTFTPLTPQAQRLQGIGASPGQVEGQVLVLTNLQSIPAIAPNTILVVPYTDSLSLKSADSFLMGRSSPENTASPPS
ncbi:MAG: glycerol-3-phosphate acyltransferase [Oculatellaceae cyanobacterium Prado106]|nr:glycerol-3-phosphate acyltransferase [Oculatellaceae cyanobacterium Prado106]